METLHGNERILTRAEAAALVSDEQLVELKAIRAVLETLPDRIVATILRDLVDQSPEPPPPVGCQHPEDKRVDLGGADWACGVRGCGFQSIAAETVGVPV